jgi:ribonuclease VapC
VIAVDTSALDEPGADACMAALEAAPGLLISAGTVAEALIVARRRGVGAGMARLLDGLGFEVVAVTPAAARRAAAAYNRWGKGVHKAALNYGDCFAYEVAKARSCRLLYLGRDFALTDIESVL